MRQLQAVITERDEALKATNLEKSRLELEAEGFSQRLKSLDESEQRYKDENWNLETQTHEMIAAAKDAANKEQKLQQQLAAATREKSAAQRELDDLHQNHGKLMDDFTAFRKIHESELNGLRKNLNLEESEKSGLQRRIDDLTSQNQELAKAIAVRFREESSEQENHLGSELDDLPMDRSEPEHSPPPSPTKGIPRHSMLESETLKSSLHHAHRMIQNLKGNINREKVEKSDLKRLLQEARDEIEIQKREPRGATYENKRLKAKTLQDFSKKPLRPNILGAARSGSTDIILDDEEWAEHSGDPSPLHAKSGRVPDGTTQLGTGLLTDMSDAYQTANETEDAFETANEPDSPTENESLASGAKGSPEESSDELTETEGHTIRGRNFRNIRPSPLPTLKPSGRFSFQSTASTSGDDEDHAMRTSMQDRPPKYRLKMNRGPRRSRMGSEPLGSSIPSSLKNSPASFVDNHGQVAQTLFAELGSFASGDSGEEADGTPSKGISSHRSTTSLKRSLTRQLSTPSINRGGSYWQAKTETDLSASVPREDLPKLRRVSLVDSSTMTDPWEPLLNEQAPTKPSTGLKDSIINAPAHPYSQSNGQAPVPQQTSGLRHDIESSSKNLPHANEDQSIDWLSGIVPSFLGESWSSPVEANSATSVNSNSQQVSEDRGVTPSLELPQVDRDSLEAMQQSDLRARASSALSLSLSPIQIVDIPPTLLPSTEIDQTEQTLPKREPPPTTKTAPSDVQSEGLDTSRIIASIFGSGDTYPISTHIAEDETGGFDEPGSDINSHGKRPFREIAPYTVQQADSKLKEHKGEVQLVLADVADQSSQTVLSSEEIDDILYSKEKKIHGGSQKSASNSAMKPLSEIGAVSPGVPRQRPPEGSESNKAKIAEQSSRESATFAKVPKRPLSTQSIRSKAGQYPPLPPDHQQAIAAAAQKVPPTETAGTMGPPLAPASAYRQNVTRSRASSRPRTPTQQHQQQLQTLASKGGMTPRVRYSSTQSQVSRRSSVSSFASELDERFNIRVDDAHVPYGFESGTDPRMIQAITQTMIGEYLWKYTRKTGRGDISSNRHRRFFWVHPYTRTLYWSDRDPAAAGRTELKAKSVSIEAVQVVIDDNPMPPGLHRKSLVICTPGRSVKLTATTGQRHETWFNALSYLLLRTGPGSSNGHTGLAEDELAEFNPKHHSGHSRTFGSRISLASFRSGLSRQSSTQRALSSLSVHQQPPTLQTQQPSTNKRHSHQQSVRRKESFPVRFSEYLRPSGSVRGSVSSRTSKIVPQESNVIEQTNESHDSAEDLQQVTEQQEREADRLENVRACCDGTTLHSETG